MKSKKHKKFIFYAKNTIALIYVHNNYAEYWMRRNFIKRKFGLMVNGFDLLLTPFTLLVDLFYSLYIYIFKHTTTDGTKDSDISE